MGPPPSTFGNQEQGWYGQQALALPTGHAQISPIGHEQREWPQPFGGNVSLPCSRPPQMPHEPGQMQWVMLPVLPATTSDTTSHNE